MFKSVLIALGIMTLTPFSAFSQSHQTVSAVGDYDNNNVFARILRGELPADIIYEDKYVLAFKDISPIKPIHILVIPKGKYRSIVSFSENAKDAEVTALIRALGKISKKLGINETGFSLMTNAGHDGGQTVPHLHFHLLAGEEVHWEQGLRQ